MFKGHHDRYNAKFNVIKSFLLIILYSSLLPTCVLKTKMVHGKHFVIHVPIKIRTHHHTHTVYTQMHGMGKDSGKDSGKASKQTIYKIMGYSTRHTGLAAGSGINGGGLAVGGAGGGGSRVGTKIHHHRHHGHSHDYRHNRGGGHNNYDDMNYDDYLNCEESLPHTGGGGGGGEVGAGGDMIFNHFSRHDEEDYPDIEEVIDDEMGDEWE